jgi:hypothetical protein
MYSKKRICFVIVARTTALLAAFVAGALQAMAADAPPARRPAPAVDIRWLIASEDAPWSTALAAPVAAQLQQAGPSTLFMAVTSPPTREAEWLLTLTPGRKPIVLSTSNQMKLGAVLAKRSPTVLKIGNEPCAASAIVAKHFWTRANSVVVAAADDPEAAILGSALAAGLRVPLLLSEREQPGQGIEAVLKDLSVERMFVAASETKTAPRWIDRRIVPSQVLPPREMEHRLVELMGRDKIRNVVVARAPDDRAEAGRTAWLAPHVAFAHGSAVILAHANAVTVAEADVKQLIERESLHVQTVTVLADYMSIGYRNVEVDSNNSEDWPSAATPGATVATRLAMLPAVPAPPATPGAKQQEAVDATPNIVAGSLPHAVATGGTSASRPVPAPPTPPPHYTVRTEPFIPTQPDQLSEFGVGRLPLESISDTSVLFARGLLRERLLANRHPQMLMVANSGIMRSLLLCEAISRATASEIKNLGVHVDEFYGRWSDSPEILSAAKTANLIVYEGHLSVQQLIDSPSLERTPLQEYPNDPDDDLEASEPPSGPEKSSSAAPRVVLAEPIPRHLQGPLNGLPIVFLQSCESLDDGMLWRLDELGGVAMIGSMTSIHSGAGSSMLNAAMNSMLYRGGTLGESLRDAQNYMLCVEELKGRRGHKEQAKGIRVALSFRLWGDPELKPWPMPLSEPRQAPVRAEWLGWNALRIDVPQARFPEIRCDKYAVSIFPNSQFAGLIHTEPPDSLNPNMKAGTKRLSPIYFFCLPLPATLTANDALTLEPSRFDARRVAVRVDRGRGVVYLVYLPDQAYPGESIVLRLKESRPIEVLGRSSP